MGKIIWFISVLVTWKKKYVKNGFICSTKDCYWKMCHPWGMLKELVYPSVTHLAELYSVYWYRVMRQMCQAHDTKKGQACFLLFILYYYNYTSTQRASFFSDSWITSVIHPRKRNFRSFFLVKIVNKSISKGLQFSNT